MKEFFSLLLGNASPLQFAAILFIAYLTAFTMLLIGTTKRDPASPRSPFCFSWSFLFSDETKKIIGNILLILLAVRFSQKWIQPEYNAFAGFAIGLISNKLAMLVILLQEKLTNKVKDQITTAVLIVCMLGLASCSTTKKVKSSAYKKVDSSGTTMSQASGTRLSDSNKSKILEDSHHDGITINFEDELDIAAEDGITKANDLTAGNVIYNAGSKKRPGPHSVNVAGKVITSDRPIKSIGITSSGKTSIVDMLQYQKRDSGQESKSQSADIAVLDEKKAKDVDRRGANVWIWLGIGVTVVFGVIIAARIGLFKKKTYTS